MEIRPPLAAEAPGAGRLVEDAVAGTPYAAMPRLALRRALEGESDESLVLVACDARAMLGVVLYGRVHGSVAGKLHLVAVAASARRRGVGARLLDAAAADLRARGTRLFVAETPDDPVTRPGLALMERGGFALEGRVPDFHRDGVDLLLLRREL